MFILAQLLTSKALLQINTPFPKRDFGVKSYSLRLLHFILVPMFSVCLFSTWKSLVGCFGLFFHLEKLWFLTGLNSNSTYQGLVRVCFLTSKCLQFGIWYVVFGICMKRKIPQLVMLAMIFLVMIQFV